MRAHARPRVGRGAHTAGAPGVLQLTLRPAEAFRAGGCLSWVAVQLTLRRGPPPALNSGAGCARMGVVPNDTLRLAPAAGCEDETVAMGAAALGLAAAVARARSTEPKETFRFRSALLAAIPSGSRARPAPGKRQSLRQRSRTPPPDHALYYYAWASNQVRTKCPLLFGLQVGSEGCMGLPCSGVCLGDHHP